MDRLISLFGKSRMQSKHGTGGRTMRLVDADAFRRELDNHWPFTKEEQSKHGIADLAKCTALTVLGQMPTHDATTLMQENINMRKIIHERVKDGRWEKIGTFLDGAMVRCSKCGGVVIFNEMNRELYNFCSVCGCKMEGEQP